MLKNCTSKSVILAPFNSTRSNMEDKSDNINIQEKEKEINDSILKYM